MTKRSKRVSIAIVGAAAFTLAGCEEEKVDAAAFPDLQSCLADAERGGMYSEQECETAFDAAQTLHVESAPRYDSLEVCEEQHGEGGVVFVLLRNHSNDKHQTSNCQWL